MVEERLVDECDGRSAAPLATEGICAIVMVRRHGDSLFTDKPGRDYPEFWSISLVALMRLGDEAFGRRPMVRTG